MSQRCAQTSPGTPPLSFSRPVAKNINLEMVTSDKVTMTASWLYSKYIKHSVTLQVIHKRRHYKKAEGEKSSNANFLGDSLKSTWIRFINSFFSPILLRQTTHRIISAPAFSLKAMGTGRCTSCFVDCLSAGTPASFQCVAKLSKLNKPIKS